MSSICKTCGAIDCNKHQFPIGKIVNLQHFSGSSPPEVFVGRWNYPNVYSGILSPKEHGDTRIFSSPELWHKNSLPISQILKYRNQIIYARTPSNIKKLQTRFLSVMKEIAMTHKSTATYFALKKPVSRNLERETRVPIIPRAAPLESARLEENAPVKPKIDYLVNDTEVKSAVAIQELHKAKTDTSTIIKILSSGLLGLKKNRRLVPTRWSITAVDDTISKEKLKPILYFPEISEFLVFNANYVGNHYSFLLLPAKYSFEVIEISLSSQPIRANITAWQDYEGFFPRKKYADSVTGAYYANRLALTEYLEKIKRQASCLVIREIRPQYYAPLGVGILREISREAFSKKPEKFQTLQSALESIQSKLRQSITNYIIRSKLLQGFGKQKRINDFL
jgi:DNA repair protein NreA